MKEICVSLIGNPNTGKTTLFNTLTGSHEHVGNWHGVTVEEKVGYLFYNENKIKLVDLPGIYSLSRLSFEEKVATDYLIKNKDNIVVNICDYNNLQRNLYLTLGLIELGCKVLMVVNQIEKKKFRKINIAKLQKKLGIKILEINAQSKESVEEIKKEICNFSCQESKINHLKGIDLHEAGKSLPKGLSNLDKNFYAIKLLEDDVDIKNKFNVDKVFNKAEEIASARYNYIDNLMNECADKQIKTYGQSKLDKIFLNKFLAFPIFLLLMATVFYLTFFSLGSFLSDGLSFILEKFVKSPILSLIESNFGSEGFLYNFFDSAIFSGVISVLTFLPQVALLFVFLSILEDSGYLARVAFMFEDILSKVGLSGKSVYTLLMGFGCSTSAILTARNMEDENAKIKTALLTPYMSCSAKFPIYVCLGGAFFGVNNVFVILGLYLLGLVIAIIMSLIYEKTILKSKEQSFILEFPPYRAIGLKQICKVFFQNVKLFLARVGTLILAMNVIVWLLGNFSFSFKYIGNVEGETSILQTLGRIFAPIFAPLGFGSWGLVSALIAGLIAKEIIVSSIALFNHVDSSKLLDFQQSLKDPASAVYFANSSSVLAYLVFCLLYFPCLASIGVLYKEIGKKWTFFGVLMQFVVAYFITMMIYNISRAFEIFGFLKVFVFLMIFLIIIFSFVFIIRKIKKKNCCNNCENCMKNCLKKK